MTSTDRMTAEIDGLKIYIDGRLIETEKRLDTRLNELKAEMQILDRKIDLNTTKIDMLQHFQTIGFTVMGIVVGFSVVMVSIAPAILDMFREKRKEKRDDEHFRKIAREELARLKADSDTI